jgi:hypothetical protein
MIVAMSLCFASTWKQQFVRESYGTSNDTYPAVLDKQLPDDILVQ